MNSQTVTRTFMVMGRDGHRQKMSFNASFCWDFSQYEGAPRIINVQCADMTGTNEYVIVSITRATAAECLNELAGQLSDGAFECVNYGEVFENIDGTWVPVDDPRI